MKSLIRNYINMLSVDNLKVFASKNDINLNQKDLEYLLNLIKENYEDILINDEKYLEDIKKNIDCNEYEKIKKLYFYYKNRYKGYLF